MEELWRDFTAALGALRDETTRRDVALVVVLVPFRAALEERAFSSVEGRAIELQAQQAWERSRRMKRIAEELGLPVLDPWEHFRKLIEAGGSDLYFVPPDDIHFSARGNVEMARWLRSALPLPPASPPGR